jgi:hypothetical protein
MPAIYASAAARTTCDPSRRVLVHELSWRVTATNSINFTLFDRRLRQDSIAGVRLRPEPMRKNNLARVPAGGWHLGLSSAYGDQLLLFTRPCHASNLRRRFRRSRSRVTKKKTPASGLLAYCVVHMQTNLQAAFPWFLGGRGELTSAERKKMSSVLGKLRVVLTGSKQ